MATPSVTTNMAEMMTALMRQATPWPRQQLQQQEQERKRAPYQKQTTPPRVQKGSPWHRIGSRQRERTLVQNASKADPHFIFPFDTQQSVHMYIYIYV